MAQFAVRAEFTDDGHQPMLLDSLVDRVERYFIRRSGIGFNLHQALRLLAKFKQYDVIFATADGSALPILALKSLGLGTRPVVYQSIGLMEFMRWRRDARLFRCYRRWVNMADIIACLTWSEYDAFVSLFGVPIQKMRFLMPCLDLDYFPAASPADSDLVLSVGRDGFRDYATLFQAVKGSNWPMRVIASPINLTGLQVPDNVSVMYDIPIAEVREWYRRSRFVVVPTRDNSYSAGHSVFLQAMGTERACVISATAAISRGYEFLRSGENCILVKPGDARELRVAIEWLWTHPEETNRIGKAAREVVERHFRPEQYAKSLVDMFNDVRRN